MTFDYAQLIMDTEAAKMIKRVVRGIPVTEETLAVDVIKQVGAAGEFISHEQTCQFFKEEQSNSNLIVRNMRDRYLAQGVKEEDIKDFTERAYEEAKQIYNNHKPDPLPEEAASAMRSILNEAEEHYGLDLTKE